MGWVQAWLYGVAGLVAGVGWALLVGTSLVLPFALIQRGRRERFTRPGAVLWARGVERMLFVRVEPSGDPGLAPGQGALFICNHRSWLDPVLLVSRAGALGLSKSQIFWIPFVGLYGWLAGTVFFSRDSRKGRTRARDDALFLLRSGSRLQVYPEGTRSRDGRLREKVFLRLPKDCFAEGIPVVPCAVYGTERTLPVGSLQAFPGQRCRLDFGSAVWPADHPDADSFAAACWAEVSARVARLEAEEQR